LTQREKEMSTCKSCFLLFLSSSRSPRVSNALLHSFVAVYHRIRAFGKGDFLPLEIVQAVSPCELSGVTLHLVYCCFMDIYVVRVTEREKKERKRGNSRNYGSKGR
jgi:hypothetical protein